MVRLIRVVLLCSAGCAFAEDVTVHYAFVSRDVIATRAGAALKENTDRGARLKELFADAGCPDGALLLQPIKHVKAPNVICTVKGETDSAILVGAHFDHVKAGDGIIDNWAGAALLPSLLESVKSAPRRHTFVFIGFTEEELGVVGSNYYASRLNEADLQRIAGMINIDSVGAGPTEVENSIADKNLLARLQTVTATMHLPLAFVNVSEIGFSDYAPFRSRHVPTVSFHSITQENLHLLHSSDDNRKALKTDHYYDTYQIVAVYLSYLDIMLDTASRPATDSRPAKHGARTH